MDFDIENQIILTQRSLRQLEMIQYYVNGAKNNMVLANECKGRSRLDVADQLEKRSNEKNTKAADWALKYAETMEEINKNI